VNNAGYFLSMIKVSRVFKMIIRSKSFQNWFKTNLKEHAEDIALHGADAGYPYITYTAHTIKIFDKFADEIWDMAVEDKAAFVWEYSYTKRAAPKIWATKT
jgi:ubiquinone biosynthesis protein COQ9